MQPRATFRGAAVCVRTACRREDAFFSSAAAGCRDLTTGLVWHQETAGGVAFTAAESYCARLDGGPWRLPRWHELRQLSLDKPSDRFSAECGRDFWSRDAGDGGRWAVNLSTTADGRKTEDAMLAVICVQGESRVPSAEPPGEEVETPARTKLLRGPSQGTFSAVAFSEETGAAGAIWNYATRESASWAAEENCRVSEFLQGKKPGGKSRCRAQVVVDRACAVWTQGDTVNGKHKGAWSTATSLKRAKDTALGICERLTKNCRMLTYGCSTGSSW